VLLWDLDSGKIVARTEVSSFGIGRPPELKFSGDGTSLIRKADSKHVVMFGIPTLKTMNELELNRDQLLATFATSDRQLVTVEQTYADRRIVAKIVGLKTSIVPKISADEISSVTPSSDGRLLLFNQYSRVVARTSPVHSSIVAVATGDVVASLAGVSGRTVSSGFALGDQVVYKLIETDPGEGKAKEVQLHSWDVATGKTRPTIAGLRSPVAVSANLTRCLEVENENEIHARDLKSGRGRPCRPTSDRAFATPRR
jgi:hypothetical protein